jgi:hypothetical protein
MKKILLTAMLSFSIVILFAQPTRTVKGGNWSDPTVWDRGVPTRSVDARVMHNITIDVDAEVRNLLDISPGASINNSSRTVTIWGDLVVSQPSGYNESGTGRTELRGENSSISGKIYFNRLRIYKNNNSFTVTANDTLFVTRYFYLFRGNLNVGDAAVVLVANSSQEANMGYSLTGTLIGTLVYQKYIDRCNEWSTYTTPIAGSFEQLAANSEGRMVYTGFPGGVDYPNYTFINTYFYDEAVGYQEPTSTSNTVNRGQGFWYWNSNEVSGGSNQSSIPQQWLIEMNQNGFNTGNVNLSVSFSSDGFNLVGNPFPGVLNWNHSSWTKTNIENAIYYWNTCTQSYASYVNGSGTNGGDQWIPAGQGFFVQATAANPVFRANTAALSLGTLAAKPLKNGGQKESDDEEENYSYITLTLNDDETVVRFTQNASTDFDNGKDARKILAPAFVQDNSALRTVVNGVSYSVNALPLEDLIIPLDVKGQGELTFTGANDFADIDIYLEDRLTGELIDMKANQSYVFDNSQTGFTHRFNIVTKSKLLSASSLNEVKLSVYPNPYSDEVSIMSGIAFDRVDIYNMLGALVISQANTSSLNNKVDVSTLNSGMYVIKVYNNNEELGTFLTKKL